MISRQPNISENIIDRLLESQQQLTAVERFSQRHADLAQPALKSHYSDLIPLELPGVDEQYSFEVDLDACSGCKACVAACHNLNGLDEGELWRNVGLLVSDEAASPVVQHVTTACHHCLEPACMYGCPVNAYEKDSVTGIVSHLDDQCIGCKYCMFTCPYDVPSYHASKGIVRKCNMCADRLSAGEAPACVQACPNQAIKIRTVSKAEVAQRVSKSNAIVPAAPASHLTRPTTLYRSQRDWNASGANAVDAGVAQALHAHWPLVLMLVLTQTALGAFLWGWLTTLCSTSSITSSKSLRLTIVNVVAMGLLGAGLNVALLHLGRPLKAYRAMANLRRSWLSREILGFNAFAGIATAAIAFGMLPPLRAWFGNWELLLTGLTVLAGIAAVACSGMLYVVTGRPMWHAKRTHSLFALTSLVMGCATLLLIDRLLNWPPVMNFIARWISDETSMTRLASPVVDILLCFGLIAAVTTKLFLENQVFASPVGNKQAFYQLAAQLMRREMSVWTNYRWSVAIACGLVLPLLLASLLAIEMNGHTVGVLLAAVIWFGLLTGEIAERYLFFAAAVAPRMPGAPNHA